MVIGVGQRCVVRVKIADVELRNARAIVATVESPQHVAPCQEVSFDEVSGLVYVVVDVNSAGPYSMWLEVRFAEEVVYTPAFVFAEVEGEATPCDAPYLVDVEVAGESVTVTPPKIDVDDGGGASITVDTVLSETSNNAIANSTVTKALKTKQDTLTLTTKPNGNIVIGNLAGQSKEFMPATPSGDPMHYAYLKVYGLSYDETTGLWAYRADEDGLTDLTTEEIQNMWLVAGGLDEKSSNYCRWAKKIDELFPARTNICSTTYGKGQGYTDSDWNYAFNQNPTIEVAVITRQPDTTDASAAQLVFCAGMFAYCYNLRKIIGGLSFLYIYKNDSRYTNMFVQCPLLESVKIWKLDRNLGFPHSSFFSKESLLFMINNCASNVSFTITLHPDVYAKCQEGGEWYSEVNTALSAAQSGKTTTITLASA